MKQSKLDNYFKIIPNYDEKNKRCFIYDPLNYKAYFDTKKEKYGLAENPSDKTLININDSFSRTYAEINSRIFVSFSSDHSSFFIVFCKSSFSLEKPFLL